MFDCFATIKKIAVLYHHRGLVIQSIVQDSGRHRRSDHKPYMGSSPCAAVQLLACKEPRTLKFNGWSDKLKLIKSSSSVIWISVSNYTAHSCHNCLKDGKYLVTSLLQAGKECNMELCFYFLWSFLMIYYF